MIGDSPMRRIWRGPARRSWRMAGRRGQCLHAHPAGAVRRAALARRADHAGRDHAAAALVSLPSLDECPIGRARYRAASGSDRAASRGRAIRAASASRSFRPAAQGASASRRAHQNRGWALFFKALDQVLKAGGAVLAKRLRQRAIERCGRLRHGATERRGWAGRDLSRDGQLA